MENLLPLRTMYWPLEKDRLYLEKLQDLIDQTNIGIHVDSKFDKYETMLRKQKLANYLRSKWELIPGLKDEAKPCKNK